MSSASERVISAADQAAYDVAASVLDPEMPLLTLADLGVLRDVSVGADGGVTVTITPTYSGCPAMATMRSDLEQRLLAHGYSNVDVAIALDPPWSTDWISEAGQRKLRETGYSLPGPVRTRAPGPVPLTLTAAPRSLVCPQCASMNTRLVSEFGATLCKAQYRCDDCLEPFDHIKEI